YNAALAYANEHSMTLVHPFNDLHVMAGQGTVAYEMLEDFKEDIHFVFAPIGGGGLCSGIGTYLKDLRPNTKIVGAEPSGAPAMYKSVKHAKVLSLDNIDVFVDGAAVKSVGELTFQVCNRVLDDIVLVEEGEICSTILDLYNEEAIVAEPAGVLSIAALDQYQKEIQGKNVICILSGGNNDITRMEEIKERSLIHKGLKCYFIIRFPQRAGALRDFLNNVLSENEDIAHFEYTKKNNRERGPALVGLELQNRTDYHALLKRMDAYGINYETLNENQELFELLV
ncbi:MAG: pyridoxal-phosphate dependent enzyme, partial [Bacteroidota bacterium]